MFSRAKENGLICGLIPKLIDGGVSLLQYADDTVILFRDDVEIDRNVKLDLYLFENMSGLKINFDKSELYLCRPNKELKLEPNPERGLEPKQ